MGIRFLQTGDWQLGMRRAYLSVEAQARYDQARLDAVAAIGRVAEEVGATFVLVCGDTFDSNLVDVQTAGRVLEVMRGCGVPWYLLPGNHDPLSAATVYDSPNFTARKPPNVHVLRDSQPVEVAPNVELVPAPWHTKHPLTDLLADACSDLAPALGVLRIGVAHGCVDQLSADPDNPALIDWRAAEQFIAEERLHYVALGDRHSLTEVGSTRRIWYAGTPEATDFDEVRPGQVLEVELDDGSCRSTPHTVGSWAFARQTFHLGDDDLEALGDWLGTFTDKTRTIVRITVVGQLSVRGMARLDALLAENANLFACIDLVERPSDLVVLPDSVDFDDLGFSGFADSTLRDLSEQSRAGNVEAADALGLLYRLTRGST